MRAIRRGVGRSHASRPGALHLGGRWLGLGCAVLLAWLAPRTTASEPPARVAQTAAGAGPQAGAPLGAPVSTPHDDMGVTAEARTNYYADNDGNTIVTPMVTVQAALNEQVSLTAHALVDVMTCASVDVISSATPKGYFQENRQEAGATFSLMRDLLSLSAGASTSRENDYSSWTASLSAARDFAARNVTLALSYAFTDSTVGRAHDAGFAKDLDSHALTLSLTQTLSPRWIAQLSVFAGLLDGYLTSPYRMVRMDNGAYNEEQAPSLRLRSAAVIQVRGALTDRAFLAASYRYYRDNWGIDSHSGELGWTWAPRRWVELRLRNRLYTQDSAVFYQQSYRRPLRYMTSDRELSAFTGDLTGARVAFPLGRLGPLAEVEFDLKADLMWQWFSEFDALPTRRFVVTEAGLRVGF